MICLVIRGTASNHSPFIKLLFRNYSFFNYKKKKRNSSKPTKSFTLTSSAFFREFISNPNDKAG